MLFFGWLCSPHSTSQASLDPVLRRQSSSSKPSEGALTYEEPSTTSGNEEQPHLSDEDSCSPRSQGRSSYGQRQRQPSRGKHVLTSSHKGDEEDPEIDLLPLQSSLDRLLNMQSPPGSPQFEAGPGPSHKKIGYLEEYFHGVELAK
eukprot:NODE_694_length_1504_cov_49.896220_g572_i0.p1 GENE.NODE_694_length_1504_cov_49.896220_g572_i0~~NODE_694_length_1504_cov_49.896220_g572_i0.p1  ORF type:complete len:146 (+),score=29.53 NODE_694_length_1504_cov_49.896220_g572_i0:622-1059(+)